MRSTSFYSIVGLVLCVGASLAGCSGDDDDDSTPPPPARTSGEGQSCASAADCTSPLVCVDLKCEKAGTTGAAGETGSGGTGATGGSGGSAGSAKGGSAGTGTGKGGTAGTAPAPVLGTEGESCTKRADCETDLHCYNQRCTASDSTGAAGGGGMGPIVKPPAPALGQDGETCVLPSDCATGLTCLPEKSDPPTGVGVCGPVNTGITPTGKSCVGECQTAADCCQIPLLLQEATTKSCADLAQKLDGVDCSDPGASASLCFVQATYCTCDNTWSCTKNMCVYKSGCSNDDLTTDGCPPYTRTGRELPTTCIDGECKDDVPVGCATDIDCEDGPVSDDQADSCSPGECTCYKATGLCYRKCDSNLDCLFGYSCDTKKTHVCVADAECTDDLFCQQKHHDLNFVCDGGTCASGCQTDLDCNPNLDSNFINQVCNQDRHVCEVIGCRDDSDCFEATVPLFCVATPAPPAGANIQSALTD